MSTALEQIKPETLSLIRSQAKHLGLSEDEYLRRLLPHGEQELALKADTGNDEFEKDMTAFTEGTEDLPVNNRTHSREDIYFDHD